MASLVKYYSWTQYLAGQVSGQAINFTSDTFKLALSNATPNVTTQSKWSDVTEISAGFGYTAGGIIIPLTFSHVGAYTIMDINAVTIAASGGDIGPFRYVIAYDDTPTDKPLIGYYDYTTNFTILDGDDFVLEPSGSPTSGHLWDIQ